MYYFRSQNNMVSGYRFLQVPFLGLGCSFLLLTGACKSDRPDPQPEGNQITAAISASNVLVVNEGVFPMGNASVTLFNGAAGTVTEDVYKTRTGQDLGDVAQSATVINGRLFIVVNNSQKIEVLDKTTFARIGTITGLVSPRYILNAGNSKAYVSDIYSNHISVVDLNQLKVVKTIPFTGWSEQMLFHFGKIWVCNYWKSHLYQIDPLTDEITDSIKIGQGAQSIVADKYDRLIVSCGGYKIPQSETGLYFVNFKTKSVEKFIHIGVNSPGFLTLNPGKDSVYYLNTSVYKISVDDVTAGNPFISSANKQFYGLGLDTRSNHVYVADAIDYVQKGKVYIYSSSGRELASFNAGINPGNFCFY